MDKSPEAFRTISEVGAELDVPQHVLRFWETKFSQIKPMKRAGGRRYYRPNDVELLQGIRHLLYEEGYTIRGVQKLLRENGASFAIEVARTGALPSQEATPVDEVDTADASSGLAAAVPSGTNISDGERQRLASALTDLEMARAALQKARAS